MADQNSSFQRLVAALSIVHDALGNTGTAFQLLEEKRHKSLNRLHLVCAAIQLSIELELMESRSAAHFDPRGAGEELLTAALYFPSIAWEKNLGEATPGSLSRKVKLNHEFDKWIFWFLFESRRDGSVPRDGLVLGSVSVQAVEQTFRSSRLYLLFHLGNHLTRLANPGVFRTTVIGARSTLNFLGQGAKWVDEIVDSYSAPILKFDNSSEVENPPSFTFEYPKGVWSIEVDELERRNKAKIHALIPAGEQNVQVLREIAQPTLWRDILNSSKEGDSGDSITDFVRRSALFANMYPFLKACLTGFSKDVQTIANRLNEFVRRLQTSFFEENAKLPFPLRETWDDAAKKVGSDILDKIKAWTKPLESALEQPDSYHPLPPSALALIPQIPSEYDYPLLTSTPDPRQFLKFTLFVEVQLEFHLDTSALLDRFLDIALRAFKRFDFIDFQSKASDSSPLTSSPTTILFVVQDVDSVPTPTSESAAKLTLFPWPLKRLHRLPKDFLHSFHAILLHPQISFDDVKPTLVSATSSIPPEIVETLEALTKDRAPRFASPADVVNLPVVAQPHN